MTNHVPDDVREAALQALKWDDVTVDWIGMLLDDSWTPGDGCTMDDVDPGAVLGTAPFTARVTSGDGAAQANPLVFTAMTIGVIATQLLVFRDTGTPTTSKMHAYIDHTASGEPLSVTVTDVEVTIGFTTADGVFRI